MKYLNLDPSFIPFERSIEFESFTFSGGEPHIKISEALATDEEVKICTRIKNFADVGFLLLATDALRRMSVEKISLFLPYFPAARQDRLMTSGEPLSVKVYADLINAANFSKVTILDAHSEVTPTLLDRVEHLSNHDFITYCLQNKSNYLLVAPDGGSLKKIYPLAQHLNGTPVITCSKNRNVETGNLSGFTAYADDLEGKTCVIVDDICDGGGTFIGLAKELKQKNAGQLILIVSHGIFSKGLTTLLKHFDHIYTTDSFCDLENNNIFTIVKLGDIFTHSFTH